MLIKTALACIMALCIAQPAWAASVEELADKVQKQYQALQSFTAEFHQVLTNASSREQQTRTGKLFFAKPALIRWETEKPEAELLVVGKDSVWNAFLDERVAYKYPVEEVLGSKTMLRFLSGAGNLKEDFKIQEQKDDSKGVQKLKLTPREAEPGLVLAYAWVDTSTSMLVRIAIEDFYGNINDVSLSSIKPNQALGKELFQYAPPKDFQTFDNTGATKGKILTK